MMIASVFRVPADSPAADSVRVEQVAKAPGLVHLYLLGPTEPDGDRLSVLFWEKEEQLDAYIESDLGQQVLTTNPNATRQVYSVQKVR
jgi:heme-degrading monooxygenase HmoA